MTMFFVSCSTTKYTLSMTHQSNEQSNFDSLYGNAALPENCSGKDECVNLNIYDLSDFVSTYNYTKISIYSNGNESVIQKEELRKFISNSTTKIDSLRLSGGSGITSESFMRGIIYGIVVFAIAPPVSHILSLGNDVKNEDEKTGVVSYSFSTLALCLASSTILSIASDYINNEISVYPILRQKNNK